MTMEHPSVTAGTSRTTHHTSTSEYTTRTGIIMVKPRKKDIVNVPTLTQMPGGFRRSLKTAEEPPACGYNTAETTQDDEDEDEDEDQGTMIDLNCKSRNHDDGNHHSDSDSDSDSGKDDDEEEDEDMDDKELVAFTQELCSQFESNDYSDIPEDPNYEITDFSQCENKEEEEQQQQQQQPSPQKKHRIETATCIETATNSDDNIYNEKGVATGMYLKAGRINPILFKVGDAWIKTTPPQGTHPPQVWVIHKLFERGVWKLAECNVFVLMKNTVLGYDERTVQMKNNGSEYVGERQGQIVKLQQFYHRLDDWEEKPKILFDDNRQVGSGWCAAYVFANTIHNNMEIPVPRGIPQFVDCFAGAGGMSCGLEMAGMDCKRLIDNDEMAQATLERNHPHADTLREDVNILIERVEKKERGYEGLLIAHHGHASPPCQGSSAANTTGSEEKKRKENEKTLLFPKKMVLGGWSTGSFENVTGMLRKKNISYLQGVMHELLFHDIQVRVGVLDSSHFGVPQSRKRLVLLASKSGFVLPEFPKPTHGPGRGLLPLVTAKDAIGFLEDIPPRDYRAEPRRVRVRDTTRGSDVFVDHHTLNEDEGYDSGDELVADKPAHTIICKRPVRHYNGKRNCSNLERAVLQTFPPHWKFSGRHGDVKRLIGNAVPPLMAKLIGKCIMECYEDGDYLQQSSEEQSACIPPSTSTDNASSCLFPLDSPDQPPSNNSSRNRPPRVSLSPKSLPTFPNDHSRIA